VRSATVIDVSDCEGVKIPRSQHTNPRKPQGSVQSKGTLTQGSHCRVAYFRRIHSGCPEGLPGAGRPYVAIQPYIEHDGGSTSIRQSLLKRSNTVFASQRRPKIPLHRSDYRSLGDRWKYVEAATRFRSSRRPCFSSRVGEDFTDARIRTLFPVSRWTVPRPTDTKLKLTERLQEQTSASSIWGTPNLGE